MGSTKGLRKPLLAVLAGERPEHVPVWLMRQAGRYLPEYRAVRARVGSFLDLCFSPDLAVEVTLQPIRRFGLDAAILFSDILVVPHALGQSVAFREGEGPALEAIGDRGGLDRLSDAHFSERLAPVFATVERLAALLPDTVALIGFAGAPWTVATYMVEGGTSRDFHHARLWAYRDPEGFGMLIDRLVTATVEYLTGQVAAGAEVVQLFDTWAGVLPEAAFRRWVIAPTKAIVSGLRARYPAVPIIGFPRGAGYLFGAYLEETGVNAVSLDSSVPVSVARDVLQPHGVVQGNLDPLLLVAGGDAMSKAVGDILDTLGGRPFIFNLGHGIVPQTPPEHVAELLALVRHA